MKHTVYEGLILAALALAVLIVVAVMLGVR